jgi:hypothetical protein
LDIESAKIKSQSVQAALIFVAGPIGLFYSNWQLAVLFLVMALLLAGAFLFPALLTWPLSWVAGYFSVKQHNVLASSYISIRKRQSNVST